MVVARVYLSYGSRFKARGCVVRLCCIIISPLTFKLFPVMSSSPTALQFLETDDLTELPFQNPVSSADTSPQPDVNTEQNAQKQLSLPRPILIYTRDQLLFLSNSPLVKAPPDMPDLKHWYG